MSAPIRIGCIADDFTGATDLANNLVRSGMRTVQTIGTPEEPFGGEADALVVALKTRTSSATDAVAQSLAAADWLLAVGAELLYFKVCSTFDSTPRGNIGPVAEALMDRVRASTCVVTPAFPEAGRTVYQGHLFVGSQLLSESSMRHHPLTPMTDASLVRLLQAQLDTGRGRQVGLLPLASVRAGQDVLAATLATQGRTHPFLVADVVDNDDLLRLGQCLPDAKLVVAGSGLAIGLAPALGFAPRPEAAALPRPAGARAIVSGSCSAATNEQVVRFLAAGGQAFAVDPLRISAGVDLVAEAMAWADGRWGVQPLLIYATARPERVQEVQRELGAARAGAMIEETLARIALAAVEAGVAQLIVAGGETSGAVVQALGVSELKIGPQIGPGVPWCHAPGTQGGDTGLHIALKSGNFGSPDFFTVAFDHLPR